MYDTGSGQIVLIDFGIACMTEKGKKKKEVAAAQSEFLYNLCNVPSGTPYFMHPTIFKKIERGRTFKWENENWTNNDVYGWAVTVWDVAGKINQLKNIPWLRNVVKKKIIDAKSLKNVPSAERTLQFLLTEANRKGKETQCEKDGKSV